MTVRELIDALEDYGDHLEVFAMGEDFENSERVAVLELDSTILPDGVVVTIVVATPTL